MKIVAKTSFHEGIITDWNKSWNGWLLIIKIINNKIWSKNQNAQLMNFNLSLTNEIVLKINKLKEYLNQRFELCSV